MNINKEILADLYSQSLRVAMQELGISKEKLYQLLKEYNIPLKNPDFSEYKLSQFQRSLIEASLLGDGHLTMSNPRNSRFMEYHSLQQEKYLLWKRDILKPISLKIYYREQHGISIDFNGKNYQTNKIYKSVGFSTRSLPCLTNMEKIWYRRDEFNNYILKNGRRIKIIPDSFQLTNFHLSIWFLDDGTNYYDRRSIYIYSDCFGCNDVYRMCQQINDLGFDASVVFEKQKYRIRFSPKNYFDFLNMVNSTIPESSGMKYKTDLSLVKPYKENYSRLHGKSAAKLTYEKMKEMLILRKNGNSVPKISKIMQMSEYAVEAFLRGRTWPEVDRSLLLGEPYEYRRKSVK